MNNTKVSPITIHLADCGIGANDTARNNILKPEIKEDPFLLIIKLII